MRMRWVVALSGAFLLCGSFHAEEALPAGSDWPQWRGPKRDGICTETGLLQEWPKGGPKLIWNSKLINKGKGIGTGYSSIAIANGRIFTMGDRGKEGLVFALDEETGKELWATRISVGKGDGPRCTPTVDGDRLYALSRQGNLVCLETATGKTLWERDYKRDFGGAMMSGWEYSESPLVDGDKLICTPGGNDAALVALNKLTGEVIWKAPIPNSSGSGYASIVIAEVGGIRQYITLLGPQRGLVGVDASNGKFLWNYRKIGNGTANIPTAIVRGNLVFTSTGYGAGAALLQLVPDGQGGVEAKELYFKRGNQLQNHHGGTILLGDYLYGGHGHNQGQPFCLHLKTGQFAWGPENSPGNGSAAVVYADGHFIFRYQDGLVALVEANPKEFRIKGQFMVQKAGGAPHWPHPVVAHGRLYLRCPDQLLCYDLKNP